MIKILTIFYLLFGLTLLFAQNNYFVSTFGNNANDGTLSAPWKTIQHGTDQLTPGDTLNIVAGTYLEKIELNISGTSGQMIVIRAYQQGDVFVDGSSFADEVPLFHADNKGYFRAEGLHFTNNYNPDGAGFFVEGRGRDIEIINCTFSNIAI